MERNDRLKPGKSLNLIEHIGNKKKTVFNMIVLIFMKQHFSKLQAFLLTRPVSIQRNNIEFKRLHGGACPKSYRIL